MYYLQVRKCGSSTNLYGIPIAKNGCLADRIKSVGPISLAYVCNKYRKKSTCFWARKEPTCIKKIHGIWSRIEWVKMGMLNVTLSKAEQYRRESPQDPKDVAFRIRTRLGNRKYSESIAVATPSARSNMDSRIKRYSEPRVATCIPRVRSTCDTDRS